MSITPEYPDGWLHFLLGAGMIELGLSLGRRETVTDRSLADASTARARRDAR